MEENQTEIQKKSVKYAGLGTRLYAQILDFIVFSPALVPYALAVYYHDRTSYSILPFYTAFHSLSYIAYRFVLHAKFGRTLGKKWAGIRVVSSEFRKISWRKSFLRILPELLLSIITILKAYYDSRIYLEHLLEMEGLPWAGVDRILRRFNPVESVAVWDSVVYYSLSVFFVLFTSKKKAIHDMIAGTRVIYEDHKNGPGRDEVNSAV
ncbi:transporter [Leptospira wolffii]|uniref:Transporter n=1 Tax=Leptospira wolffii TaxID=409998 RepID=A0A2M9Z9A0_9LEPT|nr:RDD family protein [Leptospira wolffii]PJZ64947.1 transporter [Leptospira wolffii]